MGKDKWQILTQTIRINHAPTDELVKTNSQLKQTNEISYIRVP